MDYLAKSNGSTDGGRAGASVSAGDDEDPSNSPGDEDDEVINKTEMTKSATEAEGFAKLSSAAVQANRIKEEDSGSSSVDDLRASDQLPKF